jgi:catechol 2,3-dioxygenase-like lactoylglutathione lyase family enzyme
MTLQMSVRWLVTSCFATFVVAPHFAKSEQPHQTAGAVTAVNVTVSDAARSTRFFCDVLGFAKTGERRVSGREFATLTKFPEATARVVTLQLGAETLLLTDFENVSGRPVPPDSRGNDHWFQHIAIVVSDIHAAAARLREHHVELVSDVPQRLPDWNANAAGIEALYFRDLDGHFLEVIQYPPDKGAARWHEPATELFLGIDHTANVVADTERSLSYYRDEFGLAIAGVSENYGPEQERLNGVPGAHLRITTLRPPVGPGIELLQYISPRDGRPRPVNSTPADLWHWQVELSVSAVKTCSKTCATRAVLANDPDGHVIKLTAVDTEQ